MATMGRGPGSGVGYILARDRGKVCNEQNQKDNRGPFGVTRQVQRLRFRPVVQPGPRNRLSKTPGERTPKPEPLDLALSQPAKPSRHAAGSEPASNSKSAKWRPPSC